MPLKIGDAQPSPSAPPLAPPKVNDTPQPPPSDLPPSAPVGEKTEVEPATKAEERPRHGRDRPPGWQVEDIGDGIEVWQGRLGKAAAAGAKVTLGQNMNPSFGFKLALEVLTAFLSC